MSKPNVTVIDYGMGNLLSVCRALEHCGATVNLTGDGDGIDRAERLVLPGVGAFGDGMKELAGRHLIEPITRSAADGRPLLGICLGAQMLLDSSEEFGHHAGLGLIPGAVTAIPPNGADGKPHKIPHMGWAPMQPAGDGADWSNPLLNGTPENTAFYFVHSFQLQPADADHLAAITDYNGIPVGAMVAKARIFGCQFHPEKSGPAGLDILRNFLALESQ